jgi:hypothetical protein
MKTLKALFGLLVIVCGAYLAWKVMPPYFNNYQFQDEVEAQARQLSYANPPKTEQEIRDIIAKKATEFDIPLTSDQIKVNRSGTTLGISADYTVHIDVPFYPFDLHFSSATKNKMI